MDTELGHHLLFPRDDDAASRGRRALVVTAVLTAISVVVVAMRLYARVGLIKIMGREDWTILVSLVCLPCPSWGGPSGIKNQMVDDWWML